MYEYNDENMNVNIIVNTHTSIIKKIDITVSANTKTVITNLTINTIMSVQWILFSQWHVLPPWSLWIQYRLCAQRRVATVWAQSLRSERVLPGLLSWLNRQVGKWVLKK